MPRKKAAPNMFEPAPVRTSRRLAGKAKLRMAGPQLIEHIRGLTTREELAVLMAQLEAESIPRTKAVKEALEDQEQLIDQHEQELAEEEEARAEEEEVKAAQSVRRALTARERRKYPGGLFGYAGSKGAYRRARMLASQQAPAARNAVEEAEVLAYLEALPEEQIARGANAAYVAEAAEAAAAEPYFRVPGHNRAAYHELLGYPALQAAELRQRRSLLPSLQVNGGPRTFTPEELSQMELVDYPRWVREQKKKRGGHRTRKNRR